MIPENYLSINSNEAGTALFKGIFNTAVGSKTLTQKSCSTWSTLGVINRPYAFVIVRRLN